MRLSFAVGDLAIHRVIESEGPLFVDVFSDPDT
jgi:hypothetical protein